MRDHLQLSKRKPLDIPKVMPFAAIISGGLLGYACQHDVAWIAGMSAVSLIISCFATLFYALDGEYAK